MASTATSTSSPIRTRPALPTDLPQIHAIQAHYVERSVMNFSYAAASLDEMRASYDDVLRDGFPYLVATSNSPSTPLSGSEGDKIMGYAYANAFRARAAYQYSAELSIFVHPDATSQGAGGVLLKAILQDLREAKSGTVENQRGEPERKGPDIYRLLAIMTVDPNADQADKLRRFYERSGFREVGRLEKIGWKNGTWLDTRYMQMDI